MATWHQTLYCDGLSMITPYNIILNSSSWYLFYFTYRLKCVKQQSINLNLDLHRLTINRKWLLIIKYDEDVMLYNEIAEISKPSLNNENNTTKITILKQHQVIIGSSWYLFYFTYRCRGIFRTEGNQGHVGLFDYWNIPPAEKNMSYL
jgi:hypothetical protein